MRRLLPPLMVVLATGVASAKPAPVSAPAAPDLVVALRWQASGDAPVAAGVRVLRAGPAADEPPPLPAQRVRPGETATWEHLRWWPQQHLDWVWTAQGAGLQGGTRWVAQATRLSVQPRWAGGQAAVDLAWQLGRPGAAPAQAEGGAPDQLSLQGRASLPLGQWVTLAEAAPASAAAATEPGSRTVSTHGAGHAGWRLQARVERP